MRDTEVRKHPAELHYSSQASTYALNDERKWERPSDTAKALLGFCREHRPKRVLELGVGTGRYFPFLLGDEYVGVDVCEPMLEHARERDGILRGQGFTSIRLVNDEVNAFLSRPSAGFDFIFSVGCLGFHIPITPALLQSLAGAMSAGGHLFLQTTQRSRRWALRRQLQYWRNVLTGREDNYSFFCASTPRRLRGAAAAAGLRTEWIREETARWYDKSMLLSLFHKS